MKINCAVGLRTGLKFVGALSLVLLCSPLRVAVATEVKLTGDWQVQVTEKDARFLRSPEIISATLNIVPSLEHNVEFERYDSLPVFQPTLPVWAGEGTVLRQLRTSDTAADGMLLAHSLRLYSENSESAVPLTISKDYLVDTKWAVIGRLAHGSIANDQPVYASYRFYQSRLDAIVLTRDKSILVREGEPTNTVALPSRIHKGEKLLGTIWLPGGIPRLTADNLFPILESEYPEVQQRSPSEIEAKIPKSMAKLRKGGALRILAWGDSVTEGAYLPHRDTERWQNQFVLRLRERYPKAHIELVTEAWGGRTTVSYLSEPPGALHNYREKVLGAKPDLIISEFVNDANLPAGHVMERYGKLLRDFQEIGAEWIILTPHYVRPDWMGFTRERDIDDDPRPYVAELREFARDNPVALADASKRWGRLWRQGIPYTTLFVNSINHPDQRGMKIFADSLMELFK